MESKKRPSAVPAIAEPASVGKIISASFCTCALLGGPRGPKVATLDSVAVDGWSRVVDEADVLSELLTSEVFEAMFLIKLSGYAVRGIGTGTLFGRLLGETCASVMLGYWAGSVGAEAAIQGLSAKQTWRAKVPKRDLCMRIIATVLQNTYSINYCGFKR